MLPISYPIHHVLRKLLYLQKARTLSSENLPRTLDLQKFSDGMSTVAECDEQATVVGLSMSALGDGGQVLSTVDRRL